MVVIIIAIAIALYLVFKPKKDHYLDTIRRYGHYATDEIKDPGPVDTAS